MKRGAIFSFFDAKGVVDESIVYLLKSLRPHVSYLLVVANLPLNEVGKHELEKIADKIIIRENTGFDAYGYKAGFLDILENAKEIYEEVIFLNSTFFGPLYPLDLVFNKMDDKKVDFWGIIKQHELSFDPYKILPKGENLPEHIASYWIAVRSNMFYSEKFLSYWQSLPSIKDRISATLKHELVFTKHFESAGFSWESYVENDNLKDLVESPMEFMSGTMIEKFSNPFLKKKIFGWNYSDVLWRSIGKELRKALEYVDEKTEYDVQIIWNYILRNYHLVDIIENLHLNYIIPDRGTSSYHSSSRVALFIHSYFVDMIDECLYYAKSMPEGSDIFISTDSEEKKIKIEERVQLILENKWNVKILIKNNRGRDISALLVTFKPYIKNYDYFCFIHDKKTGQTWPSLVGKDFFDRCVKNLLASKNFVGNVISLFDEKPALGVLSAPPPHHHSWKHIFDDGGWFGNFGHTKKLLALLNIEVPISVKKAPISPFGTMFWARAKALETLFAYNWEYDSFLPEPLPEDSTISHAVERSFSFVAQSLGFYSAWGLSEKYAELELNNLRHYLRCQSSRNFIKGGNTRVKNKRFDKGWKRFFRTRYWRKKANKVFGKKKNLIHEQEKSYLNDYLMERFEVSEKKPEMRDTYVEITNQNYSFEDCCAKIIAFYLPQFHPFKENDKWWGRGFTEWTNVSKAQPQFLGHYQPHLPGELGFYDLRVPEVMRRQIELAKTYGVSGFCFHYYWFGGKRLMELPINNFLADKTLDIEFCFCWANENWSRRWDGSENEILISQSHSEEDDIAFIKELFSAFEDPRYIRVNNKPMLIVYRASLLPNVAETAERWRKCAEEAGFEGLYIVAAKSFGISDPRPFGFDAAVEFPPHGERGKSIASDLIIANPRFNRNIKSYRDLMGAFSQENEDSFTNFRTVVPSWDNQARRPANGLAFFGSTPELYQEWLENSLRVTSYYKKEERFVFINAWNEWAEGAHLEPCRKYGYGYLQATANALQNTREKNSEK